MTQQEWDEVMEELQIDPKRPRGNPLAAMMAGGPALRPSSPVSVSLKPSPCEHRVRKAGTVLCNTGCPASGSEPVDLYDCSLHGLVTLTHRRKDLKNCTRCVAEGANIVPRTGTAEPSPAVAVVVISHNYAHYLGHALASVKGQTRQPDEIVVIDDSSRDYTADVAKSFGVDCIRVEVQSPNLSRKAGFEATKSPVIVFLDADDTLPPDYVERCLETLLATSADVVYTPAQEFGDAKSLWNPEPRDLMKLNFVHAGSMVRRSALEKYEVFKTGNEFPHEDWEMWRRIQRRGGKFERCGSVVYNYHIHSGSRSADRPHDNQISNHIIGCYLTGKDPQRGTNTNGDDPEKVRAWAESLNRVGCSGVLLADHDTPKINAAFPLLTVHRVDPVDPSSHAIAWRWNVLAQHIDAATVYKTLFITDVFDVEFRLDPNEMVSRKKQLYLGREESRLGSGDQGDQYMQRMFRHTHGYMPGSLGGKSLLNAGILGGWKNDVAAFCRDMWEYLKHRGPVHEQASDMVAFNLVAYLHRTAAEIWHNGEPLHSRFKGFETSRDDVCIIHK